MCAWFRKSPLEKRMKQLEKELAAVDSDLKALSRGGRRASRVLSNRRETAAPPPGADRPPETAPDARDRPRRRQPSRQAEPPPEVQQVKRIAGQIRDDRFVNYLATSLEPARPLRHERKMQRNKAILLLILAVLAILWALNSFLR